MIDINHLKDVVNEVTGQDILENSRVRDVVVARCIFWHILRKRTRMSSTEMGRFVNRDHASVLHGIKTLDNLMSYDNTIVALYDAVVNAFDDAFNVKVDDTKDKDWYIEELVRFKKMNSEIVKTNLKLREYISKLEEIIVKRGDYLREAGYVKEKQRAGTSYKAKVRKQVQLESTELGIR